MAQHIHGPLYYERMGRTGPVIAFVHPNPMDQSCWIFQMAHLRPGTAASPSISRIRPSPKADAGLTMDDMAQACWEAIDEACPARKRFWSAVRWARRIAPYMYHQRPDKTAALVLSGTGYNPTKEFTKRRIENYTANGIDYRWAYTFEDMSAAFRATPMAHFFANLFTERNEHADVQTIIHQFKALAQPYPDGHHERIACPTIILTGSEDSSHQRAFALQSAHTRIAS